MAICSNCECPSELHDESGACKGCREASRLGKPSRCCTGYSRQPGGSHSGVCTHLLGHKPWCYGVVKDENGMWTCWYPPGHPDYRRRSIVETDPPILLGRLIDCD